MAITVKHKFVSAIPDGADATIVRPSNWNDDHDLTGTIPVANGGTGASTADGAVTNLLPSQTGNNGKVLTTDGTNTSWSTNGVGDVVGPASSTDNAIARFDSTTGKLLQNSVVTIGDTGETTGITTLAASTSVTTPIVQATNSAGLALKNSAGTTQISMGAGGGDNITLASSTNINGANAQIDISPTGTGHVHMKPSGTGAVEIAPTNVGTMDNMTIGATTARNASVVDLSVTGTTSFDGAQGTAGQVLTSGGTGATPTWTTPTTGTVTSVAATVPAFLSVTGSPITSSGTLALAYSGTALPVANGGSGATTLTGLVVGNGTSAMTTVTAPSGAVVGTTDTQTLTNKRITPRVSTTTSSATPTINTDNTDQYGLTAQAVDITSFTTNLSGTPTDGQKLWIYIVGTAARAITWGASFESSTATLPSTTVSTNRLDIGFVWNTATTKWRCVAVA